MKQLYVELMPVGSIVYSKSYKLWYVSVPGKSSVVKFKLWGRAILEMIKRCHQLHKKMSKVSKKMRRRKKNGK